MILPIDLRCDSSIRIMPRADNLFPLASSMATYIYCSEAVLRIAQKKQTSPEAAEAVALVRNMFDAAAPLHSKEAMRDVLHSLKSDSAKTCVRAIDGQLVQFKRDTGNKMDDDDDDFENEWIIGHPFVRLLSIQEVLQHAQMYPPPLSLCSMWIYHYLVRRNKASGEILHSKPSQSKEDVTHFFELHRRAWEATRCCDQIREMFSDFLKSRITKVIAFACGSMTNGDQAPWALRSAYQHSLLLTIMNVVNEARKGQATEVECYVQDPDYSDFDCDVLTMYGVNILQSPEGFLEVDDSTAVLSFSPNIAVRQIVTDIACPVMMIWNSQLSDQSVAGLCEDYSTDPSSPRINGILKELYEESSFSGDLDAFEDMAIFAKKDACVQLAK